MGRRKNEVKIEDGIIYYTQAGDQNKRKAKNTVAVMRFLAGGMSEVKILADYTNSGEMDDAAIQTGYFALEVLPLDRLAIIGASPAMKELIATMAQAAGKSDVIHFASSREAAIVWLKKSSKSDES